MKHLHPSEYEYDLTNFQTIIDAFAKHLGFEEYVEEITEDPIAFFEALDQ